MFDESCGLLMEDDHVAVGEVVFGSKGVGRIDVQGHKKRCGGEGGEKGPALCVFSPDGNKEKEQQREHGE